VMKSARVKLKSTLAPLAVRDYASNLDVAPNEVEP